MFGLFTIERGGEKRQSPKRTHIAVFLDRDGTMARDVPYCSKPEDFELLPTVAEGIRLLNHHGFKTVIVTNQSGIGRGYFTEEMLHRIHQKLRDDLAKIGAFIDAIYYCPHHPDDQCQCRKPNAGLLYRAASELQIDLANSYIIGDKLLDVAAAEKAGCRVVLVPSSEPETGLFKNAQALAAGIDHICHNFYDAAAWIVSRQEKAAEESP